jgi:NADH:ubiquinone oxidoreductase subunit 2 (subunit N)
MIPPLLGFYAKLFVINGIAYSNIYIAILAIITSVISCVRYLNIIQITNFKFTNFVYVPSNTLIFRLEPIQSYIITIITMFLTLSFISPIYLIGIISYLI